MTPPMSVAWSLVAREYARHIMPGFADAARQLCQFVDIERGDRVLDVACGPGTAAQAARALGAGAVTGVDYAVEMLVVARELTAGQAGFTFVEGDALALPVEDGGYDVAISSFGAIFAPEPIRAVAELARALRPGGRAGLLAWLDGGTTQEYYELIYRHIPKHPAPHDPCDWGVPERAVAWLGTAFTAIETRSINVPFAAASPEMAWSILSSAAGRVAAGYRELGNAARRRLDDEMHRHFERFRGEDGTVDWPREALLIRSRKPVPRTKAPGEVFI